MAAGDPINFVQTTGASPFNGVTGTSNNYTFTVGGQCCACAGSCSHTGGCSYCWTHGNMTVATNQWPVTTITSNPWLPQADQLFDDKDDIKLLLVSVIDELRKLNKKLTKK